MAHWGHLSINFKDFQKTAVALREDAAKDKPDGIYKDLLLYLKAVIEVLSPGIIDRYFFLFEPNPHLFLALELKNGVNIDSIESKLAKIGRPDFIETSKIDDNTGDENNGEMAVDFFYMGSKYAIHRVGDGYKPGYGNNDEVKLMHCFCNQLFVDWSQEINFYFKCLQHRGVTMQVQKVQNRTTSV